MQNPMEQMQGVMAIRDQAARWIEATKADLVARGLGFTSGDLTVIAQSNASHPAPTSQAATPEEQAAAARVAQQAATAEYPPTGIDPGDPRLAPVAGISFAQYAIAARAIMWASDDAPLVARVLAAIGHSAADWKAASDGWTQRTTSDIIVATLYGQLYSQVGDLPQKA